MGESFFERLTNPSGCSNRIQFGVTFFGLLGVGLLLALLLELSVSPASEILVELPMLILLLGNACLNVLDRP